MAFDPLRIHLFRGVFQSICEEMGSILERTGYSPNIKERRDFSCAIFDQKGDLIAQAAHIPVHLGSARRSVLAAMDAHDFQQGDMIILNNPFQGGTHLPDLTLIAPIFDHDSGQKEPVFYVANRAHHTDIGGKTPGSLPISETIHDEGLCLSPSLLIKGHQWVNDTLDQILQASRTPNERRGDLMAQVSANKYAATRFEACIKRYGFKELKTRAQELQDYSEAMMQKELMRIPKGEYLFEDFLEDPNAPAKPKNVDRYLHRIGVKLSVAENKITVDFSGSAKQTKNSLNTVMAVVEACVLYVFCAVAHEDIPANSGCLRPITILTPEGSIVNAKFPAAVSAGNVETSQRIVDVLLGALGKASPTRMPAASCGSMNNICIGGEYPYRNEHYAYYETIAGGQGALPWEEGASATQTHMTNTRNTPIEALEHAYPFRIERYQIRRQSGGEGKYPGGNGVERVYQILHPAQVTLVTDRRIYPPNGQSGGQDGSVGENILVRNGKEVFLPGKCSFSAIPGDQIIIKTPGGGGYGQKK